MHKFSHFHSSFLLNVTSSTHKKSGSYFPSSPLPLQTFTEPGHFSLLKQILWISLTQFKKKKSPICISAIPYILSTFLQKTEVVLLQIYTLREWSMNNAGEGVFNLPSDLVKTKRQWLYWRLNSLKEHPQRRGPELCTISKMILTGKMWGQMVSWRSELSWRNTADWGDPALYRILGFSDSKGDKSSFTSGNNYCYSEILQA